jgi:hypothetical protein
MARVVADGRPDFVLVVGGVGNLGEHDRDRGAGGSASRLDALAVTINTLDLGINCVPGSPFLLADSSVHALESMRGEIGQRGANDLSLPPLNLLGAIGIPLVVLAVVMEEIHSARQRRLGFSRARRLPTRSPHVP